MSQEAAAQHSRGGIGARPINGLRRDGFVRFNGGKTLGLERAPMAQHILAIDQGTTGTTCLVVKIDPSHGTVEVKGRGYAEFEQHFSHNRAGLNISWVRSGNLAKKLAEGLEAAGIQGSDINAIGITNQRETTGIWSEAGEPLANAIVWQDRRTADTCKSAARGGAFGNGSNTNWPCFGSLFFRHKSRSGFSTMWMGCGIKPRPGRLALERLILVGLEADRR